MSETIASHFKAPLKMLVHGTAIVEMTRLTFCLGRVTFKVEVPQVHANGRQDRSVEYPQQRLQRPSTSLDMLIWILAVSRTMRDTEDERDHDGAQDANAVDTQEA